MSMIVNPSKQSANKPTDDDFPWGARIKSERERLGLTQAALAEKAGVSRATQINYERNKRCPDGNYLRALGAAGADFGYLLFGSRSTPENMYSLAAHHVLPLIAQRFGIDIEALLGILGLAAENEAHLWLDGGEVPPVAPAIDQKIVGLVNALFEQGSLLGKIFIEVGEAVRSTGSTLGPERKADLILLLYDAFRLQRRIDKRILNIAVKAARS